MTVALYAGSFDPIHLGHLGVIEQAAQTFEQVVVAVVANPQKATGMFSPDERLRLVTEATCHLPSVRPVQFHGLTAELARSVGATVLVRAAHKERRDEVSMAAVNQVVGTIPTVLLLAEAVTRTISSSLVRELVDAGELAAAQKLVPPCVMPALADSTRGARTRPPSTSDHGRHR